MCRELTRRFIYLLTERLVDTLVETSTRLSSSENASIPTPPGEEHGKSVVFTNTVHTDLREQAIDIDDPYV